MEVPNLEYRLPAAGRRVRYVMKGDEGTGIYSVLYLPAEWDAGGTYPVIVEFPGNVFYHPALCYSTATG
jgi:dipeptidyl aminopeptidase/acylaminoacyl peptidase